MIQFLPSFFRVCVEFEDAHGLPAALDIARLVIAAWPGFTQPDCWHGWREILSHQTLAFEKFARRLPGHVSMILQPFPSANLLIQTVAP